MLILEDDLRDIVETNNRLIDHFIGKIPEVSCHSMAAIDKYVLCALENSYEREMASYTEKHNTLSEIKRYFGHKCSEYVEAKKQLEDDEAWILDYCITMKYIDQPSDIPDEDEATFWGVLEDVITEEINKLKEINFIIKTKLHKTIKLEDNEIALEEEDDNP